MVIEMVAWLYKLLELSMGCIFMWSMRLESWKRGQVSLFTSSSVCIHTCKSKCLPIATGVTWHESNKQIHEHRSPSLSTWPSRVLAPAARCFRVGQRGQTSVRIFAELPYWGFLASDNFLSRPAVRDVMLSANSGAPRYSCTRWSVLIKYSVTFVSCKARSSVVVSLLPGYTHWSMGYTIWSRGTARMPPILRGGFT